MMLYKKRLMIPGPTPIPEKVVQAGLEPMIDERTEEFGRLFSELSLNLKKIINTDNDILIFSSSITGACEGAVQNLFSQGDHVLVINNGYFAERWIQICEAYNLMVHQVNFEFNEKVDFSKAKKILKENEQIKGAICVFCETSSGMMNDIELFGAVTNDILSIVDAASGLGVSEIKADQWGIDVVVSGGQKALMTPPGISFVTVSDKAWKANHTSNISKFYFDWQKAKKYSQEKYPHTPYTPAISLIFQLREATNMILDDGLQNVYKKHELLYKATREAVRSLGLRLVLEMDTVASSVTAAYLPEYINAEIFVEQLANEFGIQITDGPGIYKDKIIRIGHCGYMDPFDIIATILAIETLLQKRYGYNLLPGNAVQKAQEVFANGNLVTSNI
ncbi:pyridoxal-phosphate-dependent aminotransferase family protein [Cytobacillus horneckiae]|uniref:pyridoxal-phosphate-dependent aminotransferase family protein n=1 Tax=Cytobacillus horneckiae TaxID=549687 RepID=UPI003D20DF2C